MKMKSAKLYIGTSGWSYKHWSEVFYPLELKPEKYLEYYLTKFTSVELNSSFYNLPRKSTIAGWMSRTPGTFRFCPKMSRFITHQLQLTDTEEALQIFFDVFEGLKEKLGPVLIQLPPGLSYDKSLICNFMDRTEKSYSQYLKAIEIRNRSWINESFFNLLTEYGIGFVISDSGGQFPYHEAVTADFVYLRLHGREQLYASDYSEDDLNHYAEKITQWLEEDKDVWVFFNNDYHGYAVSNAQRLNEILNPSFLNYEANIL